TWGQLISITGTLKDTVGVQNPYRYRGYRYDSETGLYYLNARYYNPEWGRFLNADRYGGSTGVLLSHNVYAYTENNPVMLIDPSGYSPLYYNQFGGGGGGAGWIPKSNVGRTKVANNQHWNGPVVQQAKNAGRVKGKKKETDFYVTPKGEIVPATKEGFYNNLSKMNKENGKYYGSGSNGPVRVRVEGPHKSHNNIAKPNPDHDVPHVHIEHRKNGIQGPWGEGAAINNTSFPQIWLK
ncbi:RHS repeat-associated core domain-containing protein, partial [Bacillus timonensis]|nr:RHS repeat-associated core domain-containing protein [Bacillus timonensis]